MKSDSEILALIEEYEKNSYGQYDQALVEDREEALDRFYGRPYGDEVNGRSQVVSQDTKDTILWVMPQLMKVFAAGDTVCKFNPRGPEDVDAAEQETEYVNHLVMEKNRGFELFYGWFFDALLSKVGYVKAYWEEYEESERETYKNISTEEAALILQSPDIEIKAAETTVDEIGREYHTLVIESKENKGCIRLCNVPPENVFVDYGVTGANIQDADFFEEMSTVSLGDLKSQGYDVTDSDAGDTELNWGTEEQARDNYSEGEADTWQTGAMRKVTLREAYIRMGDDDGDLSLYRVLVAGKKVLEVEEAEVIPYASLCPIPMPHRHVGLSYADIVLDLERIKTRLLRNALDAQYLSIHGRFAVSDRVNLDDMLVSRAGGLVRVNGDPAGAIMPLVNPQDGSSALQAMEYIDKIRQTRTGVSEKTQGIAEDAMQETATATAKLMTAAQERIYMIARIFAETGVKDLFMLVHQLVRKHANKEAIFQLRNEWVPVDPRTWKNRKDMTVSVGLGTGDREEIRAHLMNILAAQQQAIQIGIATPKTIYNALAKLTQNAGFKNVEEFWVDPDNQPPQPPKPDPEMVKAQMEMQMKQAEMADKAQLEREKLQQEGEIAKERLAAEIALKNMEMAADIEIKRESMQMEYSLGLQKTAMSAQVQTNKIDTTPGIE